MQFQDHLESGTSRFVLKLVIPVDWYTQKEQCEFNSTIIKARFNCNIEIVHFECVNFLRADVSKYRPEVYKSEKSKILKKIHKVALGKLLT